MLKAAHSKLANSNAAIHSFIHYGDLYSTPSRLLLRSAPDPCAAKEKSFEARVKCVRKFRFDSSKCFIFKGDSFEGGSFKVGTFKRN